MPPVGAGAEMVSVSLLMPMGRVKRAGRLAETLTLTVWAPGANPAALALMIVEPTAMPLTLGLEAGTLRPAAIVTEAGVMVAIAGLALVKLTVTPPAGAAVPRLSGRGQAGAGHGFGVTGRPALPNTGSVRACALPTEGMGSGLRSQCGLLVQSGLCSSDSSHTVTGVAELQQRVAQQDPVLAACAAGQLAPVSVVGTKEACLQDLGLHFPEGLLPILLKDLRNLLARHLLNHFVCVQERVLEEAGQDPARLALAAA